MDILGVDIGGVIIDRMNDHADTSFFGDNYLATTATPGVFETLACLVNAKFGQQVFSWPEVSNAILDPTA